MHFLSRKGRAQIVITMVKTLSLLMALVVSLAFTFMVLTPRMVQWNYSNSPPPLRGQRRWLGSFAKVGILFHVLCLQTRCDPRLRFSTPLPPSPCSILTTHSHILTHNPFPSISIKIHKQSKLRKRILQAEITIMYKKCTCHLLRHWHPSEFAIASHHYQLMSKCKHCNNMPIVIY